MNMKIRVRSVYRKLHRMFSEGDHWKAERMEFIIQEGMTRIVDAERKRIANLFAGTDEWSGDEIRKRIYSELDAARKGK